MKKIIYIAIFILLGIIYVYLGLKIDDVLYKIFPNLDFLETLTHNDVIFFLPLILIDIIIGVVYMLIFKMVIAEKPTKYFLIMVCYLLFAMMISIISTIVWGMFKFMIQMNF